MWVFSIGEERRSERRKEGGSERDKGEKKKKKERGDGKRGTARTSKRIVYRRIAFNLNKLSVSNCVSFISCTLDGRVSCLGKEKEEI